MPQATCPPVPRPIVHPETLADKLQVPHRVASSAKAIVCWSRWQVSTLTISRDDLACLTHEAADISGIPFITDVDKAQVEEILGG